MKLFTLMVGDIGTNCYIVPDEEARAAAVIDPGEGADRILSVLDKNGLRLTHILLTHGHFDHILAVPELVSETGAKVVIHEDDAYCLTDARGSLAPYRRGRTGVPADIRASDGSVVGTGSLRFQFLHTPGHTRGSCVILCGELMFSGDTLFRGDCGRCDLPGGDYGSMLASLRRLNALPGNYTVYPGHGPSTTLDAERASNPYMREAANP